MHGSHTDSAERPLSTEVERRREKRRGQRLIAVFLLGCAGFAGPCLRVVSRPSPPGLWPLPYLFLFAFWLVLILLIALALRSRPGD